MDQNIVPCSSTQLDVINSTYCQNGAYIRLYTFDWVLHNYQMIMPLPKAVRSPLYVVGFYGEVCLRVYLTPNKDSVLIEIFLEKKALIQQRDASNRMPFDDAVLNLEFIDSDGMIIEDCGRLPCRKIYVNRQQNLYWRKEKNITIFVDSLRIRSKLSLRYPIVPSNNAKLSDSRSMELLSNDMKKLLNDKSHFPDIAIKVGNQIFFAHKAIVLNQLADIVKLNSDLNFKHGNFILESTDSNVNLETIFIANENAEVFFSVLHYMYSGKIYVSDALDYFRLYEFTKKYKIHELSMALKPLERHTHSKINREKFSFTWHVRGYNSLFNGPRKSRVSPAFYTGEDTMWHLMFCALQPPKIFLYLRRIHGYPRNIQTAFKLKVYNLDGTIHNEIEIKHFFESNHSNSFDSGSEFSISPTLLFNDTLQVGCDLVVSYGQMISEEKLTCIDQCPIDNFTGWTKHLHENMLEKKSFADLSLLVEGEEIRVHKSILAARSPVFQRMLQSDMTEKLLGRVVIEDISGAAMKLAVHYIYTGKLDNISMQYAPELYRTGDKYEISDLKDRCKDFIIKNLDTQHASEVLILSYLHNDRMMREAAERFMCTKAADTLLTSDGLKLMTHYPHLVRNILENLSAAFCSLPLQDVRELRRLELLQRIETFILGPYARWPHI